MRILHIAAHLGAGAGKAISGLAIELSKKNNTKNSVIILDKPQQTKYVELCQQNGVQVIETSEVAIIKEHAELADIVVFSWWGHPLSFKVFKALEGVETRLFLWSHVNGLYYPVMTPEFIELFDGAIFTSKCSYENALWRNVIEKIKANTEVVYGMGDFEPEKYRYKENYNVGKEIHIGYCGTLDYAKISKDFSYICYELQNFNSSVFIDLYGNCSSDLRKDLENRVDTSRLIFHGYVDNIEEELTRLDLFFYPLADENYATTENALVEAMSAALPIVVLNNPAERNIIENNKTGICSCDYKQFIDDCIELINDRTKASKYGQSARAYAISNYSSVINAEKFDLYVKKREIKKRIHDFEKVLGNTEIDYFLYQTGYSKDEYLKKYEDHELNQIFYSDTKSSEKHFSNYYKDFSRKLRRGIK